MIVVLYVLYFVLFTLSISILLHLQPTHHLIQPDHPVHPFQNSKLSFLHLRFYWIVALALLTSSLIDFNLLALLLQINQEVDPRSLLFQSVNLSFVQPGSNNHKEPQGLSQGTPHKLQGYYKNKLQLLK